MLIYTMLWYVVFKDFTYSKDVKTGLFTNIFGRQSSVLTNPVELVKFVFIGQLLTEK